MELSCGNYKTGGKLILILIIKRCIFFKQYCKYSKMYKTEHHKQAFWSMVENHFENNTIRCKKLVTIVLGWKNVARSFLRQKQVSMSTKTYAAVTFRHLCLPVSAWWRVMLHFYDLKQLLRVSCILWCYFQSDFRPYSKMCL